MLVPLLKKNKGIKVKLDFYCNMSKSVLDMGEVVMPFQFHSDIELNLEATDEDELYDKMIDRIESKIQNTQQQESGWAFHSIIQLEMHTVEYKPLEGGSYIKLPKEIAKKRLLLI